MDDDTRDKTFWHWIAHWRYEDGSASGVLPRLLTDNEKELLELAEEHFRGFGVEVKYVDTLKPKKQGDQQ